MEIEKNLEQGCKVQKSILANNQHVASSKNKTNRNLFILPSQSEISESGREMAYIKKLATQAPDIRQERVDELRVKIANNHYPIDAEALAERILEEHLNTSEIR